jgi:RNA polymerase sigma factor (sigma-70 family)
MSRERSDSVSEAATDEWKTQVDSFLAGDMEMIRLFAGWARSVAGHRAWGFQDSEDVVQATMLALVKNLRQGQFSGGNLRAYVRRIAKNMCIDNHDRLRRQGAAIPLDEVPEVAAPSRSSEDLERNALLDRILDRMQENCRRIVQLAYVEGYSRAEIGAQLGISEEAARVRLFRCIRTARAMCDSGTLRNKPT